MALLEYEKQSIYQAATDELNKGDEAGTYEAKLQRYQSAAQKFQTVIDYRDSKEKSALSWSKIKELKKQKDLEEESDRQKALKKADFIKRMKKLGIKLAIAAIPAAVLVTGLVHELSHKILPANNYNKAISYMDEGQYDEAIALFRKLGQYRDSEEMIEKTNELKFGAENWAEIKALKVGDTLTFGNYYGELTWQVLENNNGELLLITEKAVAAVPYNETYEFTSWETCSLRSFLNDVFYNEAFTEEEKAEIEMTHLTQPENETFFTKGGNDTDDKVFLLSYKEFQQYFTGDRFGSMCEGTDHALDTGLVVGGNNSCWWWLRSPGHSVQDASIVSHVGSLDVDGMFVNSTDGGVRPVIRVNFWD